MKFEFSTKIVRRNLISASRRRSTNLVNRTSLMFLFHICGFEGIWPFLIIRKFNLLNSNFAIWLVFIKLRWTIFVLSANGISFVLAKYSRWGPVAQLVRAPPCHGGGRGFESLLGRWNQIKYMRRDLSSAGRASALQAEGHRFEPCRSHSTKTKDIISWNRASWLQITCSKRKALRRCGSIGRAADL